MKPLSGDDSRSKSFFLPPSLFSHLFLFCYFSIPCRKPNKKWWGKKESEKEALKIYFFRPPPLLFLLPLVLLIHSLSYSLSLFFYLFVGRRFHLVDDGDPFDILLEAKERDWYKVQRHLNLLEKRLLALILAKRVTLHRMVFFSQFPVDGDGDFF